MLYRKHFEYRCGVLQVLCSWVFVGINFRNPTELLIWRLVRIGVGKETSTMSKSAPVSIVNGQVLRAGQTPEGGNGSNSGGGMVGIWTDSWFETMCPLTVDVFLSSLPNGAPGINFDGNNKYKYGAASVSCYVWPWRCCANGDAVHFIPSL